jgi:uncharacterized membrane protein YecN with MAPEG domain
MPITALYAGLVALLFLALARRVILLRRAVQAPLGDGGDRKLARAMRAHANCAEYAPLGLILIGLAESLSVPSLILHALGLALVAGRIVHAYGVSQEPENFRLRVLGMGMTLTSIAVAAGAALIGAIVHWM